jgi:Tol biopolymer transport system component
MSAKRIRLAAASSSILLILVVVLVTTGSGRDSGDPSTSEGGSSERDAAQSESTQSGHESSEHEERSNIYVVDVKSANLRQVTRNREEELAQGPSWSEEGKIAFSGADCDECFAKIFLVNPDGSGSRMIPTRVRHLFQPTWSPDGREIAAARLGAGIYSLKVRDGTARRLSSGESDEAPAWSPDGRRILFHRQVRGTNWDIYAIDTESGKLSRVTRDPLQQTNPTWSPDGTRIAFAEQQRNGKWAVWSMRPDGSGRTRLTDAAASSQEPAWSPDGTRIAFISQARGGGSVAVVNVKGEGKPERLTGKSLLASRPTWSPDGTRIAFAAKGGSEHGAGPHR